MKWNKFSIISVIVILSISYVYSGVNRNQLSNKVKSAELEHCSNSGRYNCSLIETYHAECFSRSDRAELKIRSFHTDEYRACMDKNLKNHRK